MTGRLFVDYHFHPNFQFRKPVACQAAKVWSAFQRHGLDVVVVSEHSWKRPAESFWELEAERPSESGTTLLPGVEVLTREGLDVVVFGVDAGWYAAPSLRGLLVPYGPTFDDVLRLASDPQTPLAAFLPHPFTPGTTGAVSYFGETEAKRLAGRLGGVEVSNFCYSDCLALTNRIGTKLLPQTYRRMHLTQSMEAAFHDGSDVRFLAHGSDAHFPEELGYGCLVDRVGSGAADPETVFASMTSNTNPRGEYRGQKQRWDQVNHCSRSLVITLKEAWQKGEIRRAMRRESWGQRAAWRMREALSPGDW